MIDLELYRARIGQYNSLKLNIRKMKTGLVRSSLNRALFCLYLLMLAAAVFGIAALWFNTDLCILRTRLNTKLALYYGPDIGFTLPIPILNPIAWNALMKAINRNIKNCINISHWNGGSSHIGKSSKGKEKVEHVKFLLNKRNIDVLGLSQANLFNTVNEAEIRIDKYKVVS